MKLTADQTEHRMEYEIAPPFSAAITIPVKVDGQERGIAVYVVVGTFAQRIPAGDSNAEIVREVARRIRKALK